MIRSNKRCHSHLGAKPTTSIVAHNSLPVRGQKMAAVSSGLEASIPPNPHRPRPTEINPAVKYYYHYLTTSPSSPKKKT
jgi:hypothetical protein